KQVDAHAYRDQEHAEREALERFHQAFDFGVVLGLGDQQPGDQRADDRRQADDRGGEARADHHQQAGGEEQLGALGPSGLGEQLRQQVPPADHHHRDNQRAHPQRVEQALPALLLRIGGEGAEHEDDRHDRDVLEQQHRQGRASDGRLRAGYRQHQGRGGQRKRQAECDRAAPALAEQKHDTGKRRADDGEFHRSQTKDQPADRPQAGEGELEADREQEQGDAEFREGVEAFGIRDRDVEQPLVVVDQPAEPERADEQPDQDEPDHRSDAETREHRDDDSRRAEYDQGIRQGRREGDAVHAVSMSDEMTTATVEIIIVGGGPAGVMAGLLFARAGISVCVLEKHADFFRDFRGDTVHPSTMEVLDQLGMLERFLERPHERVTGARIRIAGRDYTVGDLSHLRTPAPFIAMVPQWEFLDFLRDEAEVYPGFSLRMEAEVTGLVEENGRVVGVRLADGSEERAGKLVLMADGRSSLVRRQNLLPLIQLGAPMDVLWFRLPKADDGGKTLRGAIDSGRMAVLIDRRSYWQVAFLIPKGAAEEVKARGIGWLCDQMQALFPELD